MLETSSSKSVSVDLEAVSVRPAIVDLNGVMRGKRLPASQASKIEAGGLKLPLSTLFLDIWGRDVIGSGQVLETGDGDGVLMPTGRGPHPIPWFREPSKLLPVSMYTADGSPFEADPRHALSAILARYQAAGLTPVCACELEFYLYDLAGTEGTVRPPHIAGQQKRLTANAMYSLEDIDRFDHFLADLYAASEAMEIAVDAAISESGCGQFEINLLHTDDALKAADDAVLFKYVVKGIAAKHGFGATFMAKPYGEESGSGFHTHFSLLNAKGDNIFANGQPEGSDALRAAVAGLLNTLPSCMLVFAPHANSYRRLRDGTHAPVNLTWGYDNRTSAIRIPSGPDASRRIEHRVAGADANPYLVFTAVLGAALTGIEQNLSPGLPAEGNAYAASQGRLPATWHDAIARFGADTAVSDIFPQFLIDVFVACKKQEFDTLIARVPPAELEAYLSSV